jgi:hypothetical protein
MSFSRRNLFNVAAEDEFVVFEDRLEDERVAPPSLLCFLGKTVNLHFNLHVLLALLSHFERNLIILSFLCTSFCVENSIKSITPSRSVYFAW